MMTASGLCISVAACADGYAMHANRDLNKWMNTSNSHKLMKSVQSGKDTKANPVGLALWGHATLVGQDF